MNNIQKQIDYLNQRIEECNREDSKLYKAYLAEVFDEQEYRAKRKVLKERRAEIEEEKEKLQAVTVSREDFEAKKQKVLALAAQVNAGSEKLNLTFAEKRHLVKLLVDEVQLDINNDHLTIIGAFQGTYALHDGKFVSIPLGRNLR